MAELKRVPYVKVYDDGWLTNPITKDNPYLHHAVYKKPRQSVNNSGGTRMIVVNYGYGVFSKYKVCLYREIDKDSGRFKTRYQYIDIPKKKKVAKLYAA